MKVEIASTSTPNELEGLRMDSALIFGLQKAPKTISKGKYTYNSGTQVATLSELDLPMISDWSVTFTFE